MKIRRKVTTAILTAVMLLSPVMEISASSLSDAQKEKENLEKQLEEAQGVIDGLKDSKADIQTKVKELDQQLTSISLEITNTQAQLEEKECRDYRHPERIRGCPGGCGKPGRSYEQKDSVHV